jgi:hypothetical protein
VDLLRPFIYLFTFPSTNFLFQLYLKSLLLSQATCLLFTQTHPAFKTFTFIYQLKNKS